MGLLENLSFHRGPLLVASTSPPVKRTLFRLHLTHSLLSPLRQAMHEDYAKYLRSVQGGEPWPRLLWRRWHRNSCSLSPEVNRRLQAADFLWALLPSERFESMKDIITSLPWENLPARQVLALQ